MHHVRECCWETNPDRFPIELPSSPAPAKEGKRKDGEKCNRIAIEVLSEWVVKTIEIKLKSEGVDQMITVAERAR
jgi:hypothetical protein